MPYVLTNTSDAFNVSTAAMVEAVDTGGNPADAGKFLILDADGEVPADVLGKAPSGPGGTPTLAYQTSTLGGDVSLSSVSWSPGPSVTFGAGTWLVIGSATVQTTGNTANEHVARLHDGTTELASSQNGHLRAVGVCSSLVVQAVVVAAGSTTVTLQARDTASASNLKATAPSTSSPGASKITAIQLA